MNQQSLANSAGATSSGPALEQSGARPTAGSGSVVKDKRLQREILTARNEHLCTLCKTPIYPGQRYMRILTLRATGGVHLMKYHEPRPPQTDECILGKGR